MRRAMLLFCAVAAFMLGSCRSSFPAMSEGSYQRSQDAVKQMLGNDGYVLKDKRIVTGYHDVETYSFQNPKGEEIEYRVEVQRGERDDTPYVGEVSLVGCVSPQAVDNNYCGPNGSIKRTLDINRVNDTKGSRFSVGKTLGLVIPGAILLTALAILPEIITLSTL